MTHTLKHLLLIGLTALAAGTAEAVPAKPGLAITAKQSDGTTVTLNLIGDEYFHTYTTTDGAAVSMAADGNYYYRTADGISTVMAHNASSRSASEASFVATNLENMNVAAVAKAARKSGAMRARQEGPARVGTQVPVTDSPKIPVLLVQYSDIKFKDSDPKTTFENFFAQGSTSAYQYFVDQSNGKYTPQFDVYGPVTLSGTRATYGGNVTVNNVSTDQGVGTMVGEACNLLDSTVDFSQYDNDGNGECDVVIVLYAGVGEASSGVADSVWPCQWQLNASDYGKYLTLDKTKVNKFAVFNELNGSNTSKIDGIGTFCHEFSHCMGLPDFYDTEYSGYFGMGPWSLMDYGSYNNSGYTPCGYSAYEKEFMGWITIEEGTANTKYTLPIFNQKSEDTDKAIKVTSDYDSNEYYILENRAQQGWDLYNYAAGMMITHVTYKASYWTNNTVNNDATQCMTIIPADNSLAMSGSSIVSSSLAGDLWPYNGKTELTNSSTPAAKLNNGSSSAGYYMNKPITEITKNSDGTVSFWFIKTPAAPIAAPTALSAVVEGENTATISWQPGDENAEAYTLEVTKHRDSTATLFGEYDFTTGSYNSWKTADSTDIDKTNGVKLASSSNPGSITSPSFTTDVSGEVTVRFNAKKFSTKDNDTLTVSLSTGASTDVTLTDDYADYCVVLKGTADTSTTVKLSAVAKNRCYIKNATIFIGNDTANAPARVTETSTTYTRTFAGITDTSYQVTGLEAGTLYDYRVKATTTDTEFYLDSDWSEYEQFTTESGDDGSGDGNGDSEPTITVVATPLNAAATVNSATSATIAWEAGDDTDVTYTLELTKEESDTTEPTDPTEPTEPTEPDTPTYELVKEYSFASGKGSWTDTGSTTAENSSIRLGSGSKTGTITSPAFTTGDDGVVTIIFSAKNYNNGTKSDVSSLKVSMTGASDSQTIELTDDYKTYSVVLNGTANTSSKVSFASIESGKRVNIQSASIYKGDASSLAATAPAKVTDNTVENVRTIAGISDTSITLDDLDENSSYSYRVKAVPNDTESYTESEWTESQKFTLADQTEPTEPDTPETPTVETIETPVGTTDAQQTNTSVTLSWDAITDCDVTYSVELTKQKAQATQPTLLSSTDFTSTSHGWTKSSSGIGENTIATNGIQIGSSKSAGSLTSPAFTTDNLGAVSVTVNSKYKDSGSYLTVKLLDDGGNSLGSKSFSQTNAYKDYTVAFTDITPYASVKVQLSADKNKLIYVKRADIYLGDITAASAAPKHEQTITKTGDTILIEGITENTVTVSDLEEGASYDYRVKAVPVDTEHYAESEWSAVKSFTLGTESAIEDLLDTDAAADAVYYTLSGLRLSGAPTAPGIYIRRTATRTTKLVIK